MLKALNTAATGMLAQQTNMDVIANNMANVSTTGFKRSRAEFEDLMYQNIKEPGAVTGLNSVSPTGVQTGLGVKTAAVQKDFEAGSIKVTKNALDMGINGQGFFAIRMGDGQTGYTRDGSFKQDASGKVVDRNGNALLPEIILPPGSTEIGIDARGQVSVLLAGQVQPQNVGQVEISNFINPAGLKSIGKNLFVPSPASGLAQTGQPGNAHLGTIEQGQLEMSNVNIVDEMVNMITAQRAYETNSKVIQASDQMLQYMNNLR